MLDILVFNNVMATLASSLNSKMVKVWVSFRHNQVLVGNIIDFKFNARVMSDYS
jgi:hypothetical protein